MFVVYLAIFVVDLARPYLYSRKTKKRSSGIKFTVEVKGAGCCANPWAKVRVLEKKLDQSWKCPPVKQIASQLWLYLQEAYLQYMVLILQHSDIRIYLENSPDLPLQINFGDSETYAQEAIQHVINPGALGKGKGNSASYYGDENVDNPIIPEKKKAVKKWRVNIL